MKMHWLVEAAVRAHTPGATGLDVAQAATLTDAWDAVARAAGVTTGALAQQLAPVLRMKAADFEAGQRHALKLLPEKLARRLGVYPLREDDRAIVVATSDPTD